MPAGISVDGERSDLHRLRNARDGEARGPSSVSTTVPNDPAPTRPMPSSAAVSNNGTISPRRLNRPTARLGPSVPR